MNPHDLELIGAFHDGQLSGEDRLRVEKQLQDDSAWRGELERIKRLRVDLRTLPEKTLSPGFDQRLAAALREAAGKFPAPGVAKQHPKNWWAYGGAAAALAAAIAIVMVVAFPPSNSPSNVAGLMNEESAENSGDEQATVERDSEDGGTEISEIEDQEGVRRDVSDPRQPEEALESTEAGVSDVVQPEAVPFGAVPKAATPSDFPPATTPAAAPVAPSAQLPAPHLENSATAADRVPRQRFGPIRSLLKSADAAGASARGATLAGQGAPQVTKLSLTKQHYSAKLAGVSEESLQHVLRKNKFVFRADSKRRSQASKIARVPVDSLADSPLPDAADGTGEKKKVAKSSTVLIVEGPLAQVDLLLMELQVLSSQEASSDDIGEINEALDLLQSGKGGAQEPTDNGITGRAWLAGQPVRDKQADEASANLSSARRQDNLPSGWVRLVIDFNEATSPEAPRK